MKQTNVAFVLSAHQPYVRHLEYPRFLEEDWLYEAIVESYMPMLAMLERVAGDGLDAKITLSFSPTLCAMLNDEPLRERFVEYLERHIDLAEREVARTKVRQPEYHEMALWYLNRYTKALSSYESWQRDILSRFRTLEEEGVVSLITTAATHAYLPLYREYPCAINAQVQLGAQSHYETFGSVSRGFWLPECGYFPGLENYLQGKGIEWFQTSGASMFLSPDNVECGVYRPVRVPCGLVAFPRDFESTSLIWSNTNGYPCDGRYREFYRDIGYDLPLDYVGPYMDASGNRVFTGFKYCAITGKGNEKRPYRLEEGRRLAGLHAANFLYNVGRKGREIRKIIGRNPVSTIAIDCELFGHWWFEGVDWLEEVIRQSQGDECPVYLTSPDSFLAEGQALQCARPAFSSWGEGGFSSTWLDGSNSWIYRHIHQAIVRMGELAERFPDQSSLKRRFLNQSAREELLAMASDWPSIMYQGTDATYARRRLEGHLENFNVVYSNMCKNAVNTEWLVKAEKRDAIFPDIDYNIFNPKRQF